MELTSWQDIVIALCSASFGFALIPTIRGTEKPAFSTGLVTSIALVVMGATQATLNLWLAAVVSLIEAGLWFILTAQAKRGRRLQPQWDQVFQDVKDAPEGTIPDPANYRGLTKPPGSRG